MTRAGQTLSLPLLPSPPSATSALSSHLVVHGVQQQLLGGDALQGLADTHALDAVLQVEALAGHLQLHAAVAAQPLSVLCAAQHDGLDGHIPW